MTNLLLDTNILIHLVRGNSLAREVREYVENITEPQLFVSVVNIAEAESLVVQWKWPDNKVERLKELVSSFIVIDIEQYNTELLEAYVNIDAFSQGKKAAPNGQPLNNSSRNMGKNDLWIAATAHALNATLLTTDNDFDHLQQVYFELKRF